jgi:hypothetical protein
MIVPLKVHEPYNRYLVSFQKAISLCIGSHMYSTYILAIFSLQCHIIPRFRKSPYYINHEYSLTIAIHNSWFTYLHSIVCYNTEKYMQLTY